MANPELIPPTFCGEWRVPSKKEIRDGKASALRHLFGRPDETAVQLLTREFGVLPVEALLISPEERNRLIFSAYPVSRQQSVTDALDVKYVDNIAEPFGYVQYMPLIVASVMPGQRTGCTDTVGTLRCTKTGAHDVHQAEQPGRVINWTTA
jgi:hypothetical protein